MLKWYENPKELKRFRKQLGLTQGALAEKAGVKLSLIADIESERRRFSKKFQRPIWEALSDTQSEQRKTVELKSLLEPVPLSSLAGHSTPEGLARYRASCERMKQDYGQHWREVFKALFDQGRRNADLERRIAELRDLLQLETEAALINTERDELREKIKSREPE